MVIRRGKLYLPHLAIFQICILISMSFAIAFILSDNIVSAPPDLSTGTSGTGTESSGVHKFNFGGDEMEIIDRTNTAGSSTTPKTPGSDPGIISNTFTGKLFGDPTAAAAAQPSTIGAIGNVLLGGLAWATVAFIAVQLIGSLIGLDDEFTNALSYAAAGGAFTGSVSVFAYENFYNVAATNGGLWGAAVIGLGVAAAIFILTYSKEKKKLVTFECLPFEPPLGGANCEDCNLDPFRPCSEYRCRSLGQACELLNPGTTEEKCAWVNPKDVNSPIIQTWEKALFPNNLKYTPDNAIRPPNRGVKIISNSGKNGCIPPYTPLEFGVNLNEPAICKIDYNHTNSFDDMLYFMGGRNFHEYNHSQKMKLPGPDDLTEQGQLAPELKNDGSFSLYVRCRDANGNVNVDEFVFNFCVDPSPDTTPPIIVATSISSGGYVRHGADQTPIEVYVNEPSECKWSRDPKSFEDMENSMNCATETYQINDNLNFVCASNLTGLKNNNENKFFFRCKDQPNKKESDRIVMTQAYELILKGTQPLEILNVAPNGTLSGSSDTIPTTLFVKTDDGAEQGTSICYFSRTSQPDSYIAMFNTNNFEHSQQLDLVPGNYEYFFRCIDRGGNSAEDKVQFSVIVDKIAPTVSRVYRDEGLKIVTDEDAKCVYSQTSCNYEFNDGLQMTLTNPSQRKKHFVQWEANKNYYIKCRDDFGNEPGGNTCSIIVKSVNL
jgi:hypothetical protein